ncbi:transglycosylase domain-containing protein [Granulicatella seriolae]|uniref:PBP1A family penicillin-binding protein n=1 Tax=Granulicatella seriolae TaxID=2967226 RepID=A0ABT1WMY9_9LACT|nr:PBP1A family penicillin-binding protein [Granulicatella seriolae]
MSTNQPASRANTRKAQKQNKNKQSSPKKKSLLKRVLLIVLGVIGALFIAGAGLFTYYALSTPPISASDLQGAIETKIYDKDQQLITEIGGENREEATAEQIPQVLKDAVTSIEDQRFYTHIGIDPIRIVGSFISNLKAGGITQGGSTITQQLIKLSVFSTKEEDQTYKRKAQEAILALKIEREYSKEQILTYYLNKVYMANNVYGFQTASHYYFGKDLTDLSLAQIALLAGMPQSPSGYDPYVHPEEAKKRRDLVLTVMEDNKKITQEQMTQAQNTPISDGLVDHSATTQSDNSLIYDSFISLLVDEVKEKTGLDIYNDGLTIETTVDSGAQKELYNIVNTKEYIDFYSDNIQSAVAMVDAKTGAVRAINGGRNQTVLLGYNRATQLERSTGSTIKPLIDYGPAIEYLDYSTGQTLVDQPTTFSDGNILNNWDNSYMGAMTLRKALYLSRNTTALEVFKAVGNDNITAFLKKLGITVTNEGKEYLVESNSIGANVTPLKLAAAYAAFSNNGVYSTPYTITKITTRDGQVFDFKPQQNQAMKDSTAYMITDILKDSFTNGFATNIPISGVPQAGKTGSSNYTDAQKAAMGATGQNVIPDSWFAGYTTDYSVAVWVGYDNPYEPDHGVGTNEQTYAKLIYYNLMLYATKFVDNADWVQPSSVVSSPIEIGSNPLSLPGPRTPSSAISNELFVSGTVPSTQSTAYGIEIDPPSGLTATYDKTKKQLSVKWNAYSTSSGTPSYTVTAGNDSQTISNGTSATFSNVTGKDIVVSLTVSVGRNSSSPVSITVPLNNPESSSSSSSSSSSANSSSSGAQSSSQASSSSSAESSSTQQTPPAESSSSDD